MLPPPGTRSDLKAMLMHVITITSFSYGQGRRTLRQCLGRVWLSYLPALNARAFVTDRSYVSRYAVRSRAYAR